MALRLISVIEEVSFVYIRCLTLNILSGWFLYFDVISCGDTVTQSIIKVFVVDFCYLFFFGVCNINPNVFYFILFEA